MSSGDGARGALLGAKATVLNEVGACAAGDRSGIAEGDRVPSAASFAPSSLLACVRVALEATAAAIDGVVEALLFRRLLGVKGFAASAWAVFSFSSRSTFSATPPVAMTDRDDDGAGVEGRGGRLVSRVPMLKLGGCGIGEELWSMSVSVSRDFDGLSGVSWEESWRDSELARCALCFSSTVGRMFSVSSCVLKYASRGTNCACCSRLSD